MFLQRLGGTLRCSTQSTTPSSLPIRVHELTSRSGSPHSISLVVIPVRHATHGAQGRANGPKDSPGKRLGAKKTGDEYVIPGNIIYRQRGTLWYPGTNVGMGRDHTLYALQHGFVKYYRDPRLHPNRRYIGIVFNKLDTLPANPTAPRKRRLGMLAVPRKDALGEAEQSSQADVGIMDPATDAEGHILVASKSVTSREVPTDRVRSRPDYSYRESNWQIGRSAEKANVKVQLFERDRFKAWRKRNARRTRAIERMAMGKKKGSQRKAKKRK